MKSVIVILIFSTCLVERIHADPHATRDYELVIKKYQQYYIPPEIIQKIFDKRTIYRKTNVYARAPIFIVTRFFDDAEEGIKIANRLTRENLSLTKIDNIYDPSKKCYTGSDGVSTDAILYPLMENPFKGSYTYFSEANYRKGAKIRGYFILDLRMRQVDDVTEIRAEAFFQLADPLVSAVAFALRGNRTFNVWISRIIDDTIGYLSYVGYKTVEGFYQECKNQDGTPWVEG